ncbi:MAG: class I SAM-dependent methyltransferase [Gemmatimonadetes bacterium]|nr:class I SAM-dependent methyltransferase [Gemmatimonadota bacterium]
MDPSLRGLDLEAHLTDPARKQQFVTPMFDIIAPRYDAFTRVFSFGMDAGWKRALLDLVAPRVAQGGTVIDGACGTGDLAFQLQARRPDLVITGVDASTRMIALAQAGAARGPSFVVGDLGALPAADGTLDAITAGYGYRNTPDWRAALADAARALKPGGVLATLDFHRPANALWRALFLGYLRVAGELVGWAWHGHGIVYGYIAPSIAHFCTLAEWEHELARLGFVIEAHEVRLLGGVAWMVARKR